MISEPPYSLCFETLSNDLRLRIIKTLSAGPKSVSEMASLLGVEQSRLSHSLSMLRTCHYVQVAQAGKSHIYSLNPQALKSGDEPGLLKTMDHHFAVCCGGTCHKSEKSG